MSKMNIKIPHSNRLLDSSKKKKKTIYNSIIPNGKND